MGATWTAIAKWLEEAHGVITHRTTIQKWHDKEEPLVLDPNEELSPPEDNLETRVKLDKKVATYKSEADFYKKLYKASLRDDAKQEVIVEAIREHTQALTRVPIKHVNPSSPQGHQAQTVIAPLTDTHIGEHVYAEQMNGLNEYTFEIFNKRLYGWANQVLRHVEYRRKIAPVNELIVPMLGDMISGDIHEELSRSNLANCMEQMIRGANLIAQSLMLLAPHFEKVRVPCVVGNHGRMTRKPPMKDKYMDWDYLLYQFLAAFCNNQENIEFDIPKSFINVFSVHNRNILIMHGDSISGAGSSMAITGAISKLRGVLQYRKSLQDELEGATDIVGELEFDSVMIGHFHRVDEVDIGTGELFICGCMKGPDEFALQRLHAASKPKQIITYWHPRYGFVGKEIIYLNKYDKSKREFVDTIPNTWADLIKPATS